MCCLVTEHLLKYFKASNYVCSSAGYIFISNDTSGDGPSVFLLNQLVRCSWRAYFLRNRIHHVLSASTTRCTVTSDCSTLLCSLCLLLFELLALHCQCSLLRQPKPLPWCSLIRQTGEPLKNVNTVFGKVRVWHSGQWSLWVV